MPERSPAFVDGPVTVHLGHVLDVLPELPAASVHCCVTSPPYWGLRDYGTPPQVWGGDPDCEHEWAHAAITVERGKGGNWTQAANGPQLLTGGVQTRFAGDTRTAREDTERATVEQGFCSRCGAWLGSLGLEPTPELYVEHLVAVFREVRRVLRPDGTLWLNLGDSYAHGGNGSRDTRRWPKQSRNADGFRATHAKRGGLKPKDLVGIPWRGRPRPPGRRLVPPRRHRLGEGLADARVGDRPAHQGPRVRLPGGQLRALLLRRRGRAGAAVADHPCQRQRL